MEKCIILGICYFALLVIYHYIFAIIVVSKVDKEYKSLTVKQFSKIKKIHRGRSKFLMKELIDIIMDTQANLLREGVQLKALKVDKITFEKLQIQEHNKEIKIKTAYGIVEILE